MSQDVVAGGGKSVSRTARPPLPRRRWRRVLAAAVVTMVAAAACSSEPAPSGQQAGVESGGLGHIHGLGIDPADSAVYVASHLGLFRVADGGRPERIGPARDVMGFTVVGPRIFLASGHPGLEENVSSPHLGLQASRDAGRTREHVSEAGQADYHSLASVGAGLYVFDSLSERVRHSADAGKSWAPGARIPALDLAAHPSTPEQVWAATMDGLLRSSDRGRTFQPTAGSPPLVEIEQPAAGLLIGVAADGQVYRAAPDKLAWQRAGTVAAAPVTALGAVGDRTVLVATEQGVHRSDDAGATFTLLPGTAP
jgi:hypothetical protein